ncbi:MAG: DNA-3-methyladenine glycosylase family protein [Candidatus Puniceispirillales bacterium]|jgi:DNA-3-methyladenine glycosylase II
MNSKWNNQMMNAFKAIIKTDDNIKEIFEKFGYPENRSIPEGFESLTKIIIGQQISTNVAKKIYTKLRDKNILNEKTLSKMSYEELKSFGLSSQKSNYIKNLASLVHKKELDLTILSKINSDDIDEILIKVKGIGKWTINNYKIFALQNVDAWPTADLALQEAMKLIKKLSYRPAENEMEVIGDKWKPYRGAGALFLWHYYNSIKFSK